MNRVIANTNLVLTVMVLLVGMIVPPLSADHYFCNESGTTAGVWSDPGNWENQADCQGTVQSSIPSFNDKVIILSGKTCSVDISNAEADHLVVTGTLNIAAGSSGGGNNRRLTIDSGASQTSTIDGTINLLGEFSSLVFSSTNPILSGSGKIVGSHNNAKIDISGREVTSLIIIEGHMQIAGGGNTDKFINENVVDANHNGVLLFTNCLIDDDSTGAAIWRVSKLTTSGTPVMRLNQLVPGNPNSTFLNGEFQVYDGLLDVMTTTTTPGKLKHYGGKITTDSDSTITFSDNFSEDSICQSDPC